MPVKPMTRGQMWLLPPSLDDMIPQNHVVRFVADFVNALPLKEMGLRNDPAPRGGLQYDVRLLLAAWIYGFMTRVRSTRRLEVAARETRPSSGCWAGSTLITVHLGALFQSEPQDHASVVQADSADMVEVPAGFVLHRDRRDTRECGVAR